MRDSLRGFGSGELLLLLLELRPKSKVLGVCKILRRARPVLVENVLSGLVIVGSRLISGLRCARKPTYYL